MTASEENLREYTLAVAHAMETDAYIGSLMQELERSGLVSIRRGAGGGCILNRSLADLTLLDIIKAADEEFFLNPCLDSQYQCGYAASFDGCKVHCELARVQRVLEEELKRTSLDRLFNKSG